MKNKEKGGGEQELFFSSIVMMEEEKGEDRGEINCLFLLGRQFRLSKEGGERAGDLCLLLLHCR